MTGAPQVAMRKASQMWQVFFPSQTLHVFFFSFAKPSDFWFGPLQKGTICSSVINKFDTTLELKDVHTKGNMFLSNRPTNLINYDLTNAKCNENYIITNCSFILILQECIIHDYTVMFHVHD